MENYIKKEKRCHRLKIMYIIHVIVLYLVRINWSPFVSFFIKEIFLHFHLWLTYIKKWEIFRNAILYFIFLSLFFIFSTPKIHKLQCARYFIHCTHSLHFIYFCVMFFQFIYLFLFILLSFHFSKLVVFVVIWWISCKLHKKLFRFDIFFMLFLIGKKTFHEMNGYWGFKMHAQSIFCIGTV